MDCGVPYFVGTLKISNCFGVLVLWFFMQVGVRYTSCMFSLAGQVLFVFSALCYVHQIEAWHLGNVHYIARGGLLDGKPFNSIINVIAYA